MAVAFAYLLLKKKENHPPVKTHFPGHTFQPLPDPVDSTFWEWYAGGGYYDSTALSQKHLSWPAWLLCMISNDQLPIKRRVHFALQAREYLDSNFTFLKNLRHVSEDYYTKDSISGLECLLFFKAQSLTDEQIAADSTTLSMLGFGAPNSVFLIGQYYSWIQYPWSWPAAERGTDSILRANPGNLFALQYRSDLLLKKNQKEEAIKIKQELIKKKYNASYNLNIAAKALCAIRDTVKSRNFLDNIRETKSTHAFFLAPLYLQLGDTLAAHSMAENVLADSSDHLQYTSAYLFLLELSLRTRKIDEAHRLLNHPVITLPLKYVSDNTAYNRLIYLQLTYALFSNNQSLFDSTYTANSVFGKLYFGHPKEELCNSIQQDFHFQKAVGI